MESQGCNDGFLETGGAGPGADSGRRFVILRHAGAAPGAAVHWDLLLEVAGREGLVTFQIARPPEEWVGTGPVTAVRLADHRRVYLSYEGAISGGRGEVRRVEEGELRLEEFGETALRGTLRGAKLQAGIAGQAVAGGSGAWELRFVGV